MDEPEDRVVALMANLERSVAAAREARRRHRSRARCLRLIGGTDERCGLPECHPVHDPLGGRYFADDVTSSMRVHPFDLMPLCPEDEPAVFAEYEHIAEHGDEWWRPHVLEERDRMLREEATGGSQTG